MFRPYTRKRIQENEKIPNMRVPRLDPEQGVDWFFISKLQTKSVKHET